MTKLCVNCKHFNNSGLYQFEWCQNPRLGVNLVDGKTNTILAVTNRKNFNTIDTCGSAGNWFEAKCEPSSEEKKWTYMTVPKPPTSEKVMISGKPSLWKKVKEFLNVQS